MECFGAQLANVHYPLRLSTKRHAKKQVMRLFVRSVPMLRDKRLRLREIVQNVERNGTQKLSALVTTFVWNVIVSKSLTPKHIAFARLPMHDDKL